MGCATPPIPTGGRGQMSSLATSAGVTAPPPTDDVLLDVRNLKTHFFTDEGLVRAVDGVSYQIRRGRTIGIVGESGCGKSVTAQSILRIVPRPGRIVEGEILFQRRDAPGGGTPPVVDLTQMDAGGREIRSIRGNEIALIFQEPMSSLSPVHTVGHQMIETIRLHQRVGKAEARERAIDSLRRVGIPRPNEAVDRYTYQLSGGQRQRAVIALALSCRPSLLIADEPTTALDVTTEAQILELMKELQREYGMAIQIITHNLGLIAEMADDVVVMYLGKEVEQAPVQEIFNNPKHPYTKALLRSIPRLGQKSKGRRLESIKGMVPDPFSVPEGCAFHTRCPF